MSRPDLVDVYGIDYSRLRSWGPLAESACAGRALSRSCGSRPKTSDASATTVAPHERGHDERPHRQQKKANQFDDRWYEALVCTTTAPSYMNAAPESTTISPTQRG